MGTAIKHPVPDRVKPFVIFDIRALRADRRSAKMTALLGLALDAL